MQCYSQINYNLLLLFEKEVFNILKVYILYKTNTLTSEDITTKTIIKYVLK